MDRCCSIWVWRKEEGILCVSFRILSYTSLKTSKKQFGGSVGWMIFLFKKKYEYLYYLRLQHQPLKSINDEIRAYPDIILFILYSFFKVQ